LFWKKSLTSETRDEEGHQLQDVTDTDFQGLLAVILGDETDKTLSPASVIWNGDLMTFAHNSSPGKPDEISQQNTADVSGAPQVPDLSHDYMLRDEE
jgi:hypothetical protein